MISSIMNYVNKDSETPILFFKRKVEEFVTERNWKKYHKPKDLIHALSIEVAELSEPFLFKNYSIGEILENKMLLENISDEIADVFIYLISLVNSLSIVHIKILKFMSSPLEYLEENNISQQQIQGGFSQFFPVAIPNVSLDVIESAFGDLYQYGFTRTDKSIFHTMTSGGGLNLLGNRITEFGHKFMSFCKKPN